jgi:unspecific peroxygenase
MSLTNYCKFSSFSQRFGAGKYNITVAAEFRFQRIQDSIATNPNFSFISPRYFTAYAESVFPILYFVDGRVEDGQLGMDAARSFFQNSRMPDGFFRANKSMGFAEVGVGMAQVFAPHQILPGNNQGVGNYVLDPNSGNFNSSCLLYSNFVNGTVRSLYPNPTGALRTALNTNLDIFFNTLGGGCTQVFPFGQ